jgi:hypothetical protein
MAYCIFLKSMRILQEFRKNSHIKILKILFNFERIFSAFWPSRPAQPMWPNWPTRGGGGEGVMPSSSMSRLSTAASPRALPRRTEPLPTSTPWQTDQRFSPPSMAILNSATPPPPRSVMVGFNDSRFLLHYSSAAASPHRLTAPIKGRRLHRFSPHPTPIFCPSTKA